MQLKFRRLATAAQAPQQATPGAAGLDLVAVGYDRAYSPSYGHEITYIHTYKLGVAVEIPQGYVGLLTARSSVAKTGASLANGVGVIDADYRGELAVKFYSPQELAPYNLGDRVAQLVVVPVASLELVEVDTLSTTARGAGAFGSTGA